MNIRDHMTIKWEDDVDRYCLHIHQETMPDNPRNMDDSQERLTTMACWHRRYSIGDDIGKMDAGEFWVDLVRKNVPESDVNEAVIAGKLSSVSARECDDDPGFYDVSLNPGSDEYDFGGVAKDSIVYSVLDELRIEDCQALLRPYAEWLPIWGYDHGGLSISCGPRVYPFNDRWDSCFLGFIIALKDRVVTEFRLDPNNDSVWREKAAEIMKDDVEMSNQYFAGEVYWYELHEFVDDGSEDGCWDEIDNCGGFYGDDPLKNGMANAVGCNLKEAIEKNQCEVGSAEKRVIWVL